MKILTEVVLNPWAREFVKGANEHRIAGMGEGIYYTFKDMTVVAVVPDPRFAGTAYENWFHILQFAGKTIPESEWTSESFSSIIEVLEASIAAARVERTIESFGGEGTLPGDRMTG